MIYKSKEIKVPESVPFALVYAILESVCEKRVTGKMLSFLDKKTKGQGGRGIKRRGRGSQSEADDEVTDEAEVCVKAVLLRKLWQGLSKKKGNKREDVQSIF